MIERMIQYPRKSGSNDGIIRDTRPIFTCAPNETKCESYSLQ
jgi:hypothetical protein